MITDKTLDLMIEKGFTPEQIIEIITILEASETARRPPRSTQSKPAGPQERWGYEGPQTPRLSERDWWPLRNSIIQRDNWTCQYCGYSAEDGGNLCADHVVPLSRGGTNEADNLVCCCLPCNSSKSDRLLSEWKGRYQ